MAKALYGFITYPESIDTDDMAKWLDETLQVDWKRCLHDKDVTKEGKPKKAHVHWLIGFEKSAKAIKELLKIFASRWYYIPHDSQPIEDKFYNRIPENVREHLQKVPDAEICTTLEAKPLVTRFLQMRSSEGAEDYLEHLNQPEKASYKGLSISSEFWDINQYLTYAEKRAQKRTEKGNQIAELLATIRSTKCHNFSELMDFLSENSPQLLGLAFEKAYAVEKYMVSNDQRHEIVSLNRQCLDLLAQKDDLQAEIDDLHALLKEKQQIIDSLCEKYACVVDAYTYETGENPDIEFED
jgi:predicted transcriptional regulator